jgi:hypothetical protein
MRTAFREQDTPVMIYRPPLKPSLSKQILRGITIALMILCIIAVTIGISMLSPHVDVKTLGKVIQKTCDHVASKDARFVDEHQITFNRCE